MKYLIITGASSGIGKKTAERFLLENWSIINLSRTPLKLENVCNYYADFTLSGWQNQILSDIESKLKGGSTISLVHNAARHVNDQVQTIEDGDLRKTMEVNIIAASILNKALIPLMGEGSSILYIGSTLSEKAVQNAASYVISKHAILGMMRATCQDLMGSGIHTACICPGFTDTKMLREHLQNDLEIIDLIKSRTSYNRLIKPEEISDLIWYCSNHPVLNGAIIHANLGQVEY